MKIYLNNAVDFTQNTSKYWLSANLSIKKKIQNLVFPDGLVIDTVNRQYLTSNMNSLFTLKRLFSADNVLNEKGLSTDFSEKSYLVAISDEISNFELINDLVLVVEFLEYMEEYSL